MDSQIDSPKNNQLFSKSNIIFYTIAFGIFIFVFYHFAEIKTISYLFKQIQPFWLVVAIVAQIGTYVSLAKVYRSLILFGEDKKTLGFKSILRLSFISVFLNHSIPSGGVSGNVFLFSSFSKRGFSSRQSASVIVTESITFYITYLCLILTTLITFIISIKIVVPKLFFIILILGLVFFSVLMIIMSLIGQGQSMSSFVRNIYKLKLIKIFLSKSNQATPESVHLPNPWRLMFANKKLMFQVIFFQILLFIFDTFTVFALFKGLHVDISFWLVFLAFVPTTVVGALPISPGSLIAYESGMTFFYTSLGLPFGPVFIITLMYRTISFWLTIPIGVFFYGKLTKEKHF